MEGKNTYFISDAHLGAGYLSNPRECEMRLVRWLTYVKPTAARIFLLGDIIDYWFEYRNVVPRGYVRFFGKLAELADSGIEITWITGNHDIWIFDYLPTELGIKVVDGPISVDIDGHRFFLDHGDKVGNQPLGYRMMMAFFHNRFCQKLYAGLHPRLTVPFASGWSKTNRTSRSTAKVGTGIAKGLQILKDFSEQHSATHPDIDYYVYGHIHTVVQHKLSTGKTMLVIGEWIEACTYACFDGTELTMHTFLTD